MTVAAVFTSARRYYLQKAFQAGEVEDFGARGAWLAKQDAETGTALDSAVPHQADLAALVPPYTTAEDLDGATVDELVKVGLSRSKARAVIDAL